MITHRCTDPTCPAKAIDFAYRGDHEHDEYGLLYIDGVHRCGAIRPDGTPCANRTAFGARCVHHQAPLSEDRDTAWADQQADDDEHDAEQDGTSNDGDDAPHDEDHRQQPQQEQHGSASTR